MCNHTYTSDFRRQRTIGKSCPYTDFYQKLVDASPDTAGGLGAPMPLDPTGACIFHSSATEWKRENGFWSHFLQLLRILDGQESGSGECDFAEFCFVAEKSESKGSGKSSKAALRLSDIKVQKRAAFIGASFLDDVDFTDVNFLDGATFQEATFHGDFACNRARFRGVDFDRALFKGKTSFQETAFDSYALFTAARFGGSRVSFEDSSFDGISDFSNAAFELQDAEAVVRFRNVEFRDFLDFKGTDFNSQVEFDRVSFGSIAEFIDTNFRLVRSTARYRGAAVEFTEIEVLEGAELTFKSTSPAKKLFSHDAIFSFKADPQGIVRFENVNFNAITPASRKRLTLLAKSGKVEIGSGCIKYRFQTETRTIPISEGNAPLILELAETFSRYFTVQNGVNLGFEVVERTSAHISFFYFTDENIQEAEFLERLRRTEHDLWNLLAIRPDVFHLLDRGASQESITSPQTAIINAVDGVSALIGTFFRVGIRIASGRWREADTRALLEAIRFNPESLEARAATLHKVILGRYTGRNLVGISRAQNEGLPAIESVSGSLLAGFGGSSDSGVQPAKVTILFLGANASASPLQLEKEVSKIQENLKLAKERDNLVLRQEWAVTMDTLMQSTLALHCL